MNKYKFLITEEKIEHLFDIRNKSYYKLYNQDISTEDDKSLFCYFIKNNVIICMSRLTPGDSVRNWKYSTFIDSKFSYLLDKPYIESGAYYEFIKLTDEDVMNYQKRLLLKLKKIYGNNAIILSIIVPWAMQKIKKNNLKYAILGTEEKYDNKIIQYIDIVNKL